MVKSKIDTFRSKLLSLKTIGLDSMVFIYQFSDHPRYAPLTHVVFELLEQKKLHSVTSTITVAEVFVEPEKKKNQIIIAEYEKVFHYLPNLEIVSVDWQLARLASRLRATYKYLRTPDALQLAASLLKGYVAFLTNDDKLKKIDLLPIIILKNFI